MHIDSLVEQGGPPPGLYNVLPQLEAAHIAVHTKGLVDRMLRTVPQVFARHRIYDRWGIYLLHGHWQIREGEFPGEDLSIEGRAPECMMRPIPASLSGYVPLTYTLRNGIFRALELSRTPYAREANAVLMGKQEFLSELKEVLEEQDLGGYFGLVAVRGSNPRRRWIEFTDEAQRISRSKFLPPGTVVDKDLIQTSWVFKAKPRAHQYCSKFLCWNCYNPEGSAHVILASEAKQ